MGDLKSREIFEMRRMCDDMFRGLHAEGKHGGLPSQDELQLARPVPAVGDLLSQVSAAEPVAAAADLLLPASTTESLPHWALTTGPPRLATLPPAGYAWPVATGIQNGPFQSPPSVAAMMARDESNP